ncbi:MAG: iron hydrogenase small subunit [Bacteroidetes bacterium]|uniref:Iron hydrogenase small subunit n=1 Tax=Candidatus Pullibacteroides excrementavium TaxID=2840905 RepID=A0A9D9H240_9BACT|nr:iron hydrogenase small subunit [Candidatus Pullibacteroides excrementavium]
MEKKEITLQIDRHTVSVPEGTMILEAARKVGINIPTLCHINLEGTCIKSSPASCRICVVEVEGRKNLAPACATRCTEGMVVKTSTLRVMNARKVIAELILSDHPNDCLTCPKSGNCELQALALRFNVREMPYAGGELSLRKKEVTASIVRNMDKCIFCRRCESVCNEVQTVGALGAVRRGFNTTIAPAFDKKLSESECTYCGQCVAVCPVGALTERDHTNRLLEDLEDPDKVVLVQTAPAVRVALGEAFGMEPGTIVTGKMVTALRELGFNYVFDTDFAADLTIMEEGAEVLDRLSRFLEGDKTVALPILTSCCPAWVNFFEHYFPDMLNIPSTARSPQQMFGSIAKSYWAEKMGIPREKLVVVSIMPCLAKKYECDREEFKVDGNPDVDYSISTRELATLIKRANIDFEGLPDSEFDMPLGASTGAGVIFGASGGVMEAALRSVYEIYTGKTLEKVDFETVRGMDGFRKATVDLNGFELKVGIAHGLGNARKLLEEIRRHECEYHVIEIMACPGGCIGGGGQPLHHGRAEVLKARAEAIYREDEGKPIRKSHENPYIQQLYEECLGKPLSERAHHLLHTHYFNKSN